MALLHSVEEGFLDSARNSVFFIIYSQKKRAAVVTKFAFFAVFIIVAVMFCFFINQNPYLISYILTYQISMSKSC